MKKDFQKSDDDIDDFLARKTKPAQKAKSDESATERITPKPEAKRPSKPSDEAPKEETDEEKEEQIKAARTGRAQAEAYHDVAILRKKAHEHSHRAAKLYHKYKANQAKAQKCSSRAVALREKSDERRDKAKEYRSCIRDYEAELEGVAEEKSDLSPEAIQNRIATLERKAAKQDEIAKKKEHGASLQTEKGAKFRTRAARYLEKSRLHDSEARMFTKRADNLERAG
jgi:uncharacterized coiled-coil DUF342 family protein